MLPDLVSLWESSFQMTQILFVIFKVVVAVQAARCEQVS